MKEGSFGKLELLKLKEWRWIFSIVPNLGTKEDIEEISCTILDIQFVERPVLIANKK